MNILFNLFFKDLKTHSKLLNTVVLYQKDPRIHINLLYEKYGNNIQNINTQEEDNLLKSHDRWVFFSSFDNHRLCPLFKFYVQSLLNYPIGSFKPLACDFHIDSSFNQELKLHPDDQDLLTHFAIYYKMKEISILPLFPFETIL